LQAAVMPTIMMVRRIKTKQKILKLILSFFVYAKFGIAIFITFRLSNIANAIEAIENTTADIKIILNEVADGK
jgi:hypothetical protein